MIRKFGLYLGNQNSSTHLMMKHTALTFMALPIGAATALAADGRPNVVFAFGDDYGRYASIYAQMDKTDHISGLIHTPNFDRVAREGVLFTNAYAPAPTSTACRSSLMSGQYFWRTGLGAFLHGVWNEAIPAFPLILEQNGYQIGHTYKTWGPGNGIDVPIGGSRTKYVGHGTEWNSFSLVVSPSNDMDAARQRLLDEVRGNFSDFLDARDKSKPFYYWWGPTNTHRSWARGSGKSIWDIDPDKLKGRMPSYLPDVPEIREDMADYLGECLAFDEGLGVLISVLEEIGELDNTIIVVSGDHGIPGFPRGKTNLYNLGTHVGLAICYPAGVKGGRVVTDFVNLMDLAPTFLEFGESPVPEEMTGRSIKGILESGKSGRVDKSRDYVVVGRERHVRGARHGNLSYPNRAIITDGYEYVRNFEPTRWPMGTFKSEFLDLDNGPTKVWYMQHYGEEQYAWEMDLAFGRRPYEELYDLKKDPDEVHNLAYDPRYQKIRKELSERLEKILAETNDPRMAPGLCVFDTDEYVSNRPLNKNYNKKRQEFNER